MELHSWIFHHESAECILRTGFWYGSLGVRTEPGLCWICSLSFFADIEYSSDFWVKVVCYVPFYYLCDRSTFAVSNITVEADGWNFRTSNSLLCVPLENNLDFISIHLSWSSIFSWSLTSSVASSAWFIPFYSRPIVHCKPFSAVALEEFELMNIFLLVIMWKWLCLNSCCKWCLFELFSFK